MEKWLVLQHTPDDNPGTLLDWLLSRRVRHEIRHVYLDDRLPSPEEFHTLVVLGGPMNVDEERQYPWLRTEKKLIERAVDAGNPIVGICLGGQLLGQVLGAEVRKNRHREVGWHEIRRTEDHPGLASWPESLPVFHWHEDRFTLPAGTRSLFTSIATEHQGFALGDRIVGLQFHPESSREWIVSSCEDLDERYSGPYVQRQDSIRRGLDVHLPGMTRRFHEFLDSFRDLHR
ncbi:MAG: type 1 glutamine amidotransferase [Bdellovibrionales bacterium]|nr:type 1 glutamine amidotransferase [Bdellovibrionales bacterium]